MSNHNTAFLSVMKPIADSGSFETIGKIAGVSTSNLKGYTSHFQDTRISRLFKTERYPSEFIRK